MKFYQRLRDLREDADKTQREIAEYLNDSRQHYQLYECGKIQIPFDKAIKLDNEQHEIIKRTCEFNTSL